MQGASNGTHPNAPCDNGNILVYDDATLPETGPI